MFSFSFRNAQDHLKKYKSISKSRRKDCHYSLALGPYLDRERLKGCVLPRNFCILTRKACYRDHQYDSPKKYKHYTLVTSYQN